VDSDLVDSEEELRVAAGTGPVVVATMADARAEASRVGGREGVARVEGEEEEVTAEEHSVGPTAGAGAAAMAGWKEDSKVGVASADGATAGARGAAMAGWKEDSKVGVASAEGETEAALAAVRGE
jgi:hypothetical protein